MLRHLTCCLLSLTAAAVLALTASAQNNAPIRDLIDQLKDKDEAVRLKAAKELGKLKEKAKAAISALTITASQGEGEDVRTVAKKSLEAIKDALAQGDKDESRKALEPLLRDLRSRDAAKRI